MFFMLLVVGGEIVVVCFESLFLVQQYGKNLPVLPNFGRIGLH